MALIGRILVIIVAFLAASLSACIVLVFALFNPGWGGDPAALDEGAFAVVAMVGFVLVGGFGLIPAALLALITEVLNVRSVLVYAIGGAVLGVLGYLSIAHLDADAMTTLSGARHDLEVIASAGIVAGLVYWLIAGRNAGRWREASSINRGH
jgi:hypothetical protein